MVTPHELLLGVPPNYAMLRVFGSLCYPNLTATTQNKLSPRSAACVFLGYPADHRGYLCYEPKSRRVFTTRHVVFDETAFPFRALSTHGTSPAPTPQALCDDDTCASPLVSQCRAYSPGTHARKEEE
jgi:histone deacetylase 1/2